MSEQPDQTPQSEQPRDGKTGKFASKETAPTAPTQPTTNDYSKMNAILQKQTGLSAEKFVDYQSKMTPRELFDKLSFMADNVEPNRAAPKSTTLPPNQPIIPITPQPNAIEFPGTVIGKPNLDSDKFSLHLTMSPSELLKSDKKK